VKTFSTAPAGESHKNISCALCGSSSFKLHWDCDSYQFQTCAGCGIRYQNPQPIPKDIIKRYDQEYYKYELENEENFFRLMMLGLGDTGFFPLEAGLQKEKSFLDIGCATGRLLEEMRSRGWSSQGVEVCGPSARHAGEIRGLDVHNGTLDTAPFPPGKFDVIHFSHVIEHINDPVVFLKQVFNLLKPGGTVFIVTPCFTGIQARLFGTKWRSAIADHLYLFSKKQLERILVLTGFQPLKWKTWGGLGVGTAPSWIKRIIDPFAKLTGLGDVIMVRAQRPI